MRLQRKFLPVEFDEVKAASREFSGYASTFGGTPDSYGDLIQKGAFSQTLKERHPMMLWSHDTNEIIGKWTAISEDEKGLRVSGKLTAGVQRADEAYALMKDGAFNGMSIGYSTVSSRKENGNRVLEQIKLFEISLVGIPANDSAQVDHVKSMDAIKASKSYGDVEDILRDAGFSRTEAAAIVSQIKAIAQSESESKAEMDELLKTLRRFGN